MFKLSKLLFKGTTAPRTNRTVATPHHLQHDRHGTDAVPPSPDPSAEEVGVEHDHAAWSVRLEALIVVCGSWLFFVCGVSNVCNVSSVLFCSLLSLLSFCLFCLVVSLMSLVFVFSSSLFFSLLLFLSSFLLLFLLFVLNATHVHQGTHAKSLWPPMNCGAKCWWRIFGIYWPTKKNNANCCRTTLAAMLRTWTTTTTTVRVVVVVVTGLRSANRRNGRCTNWRFNWAHENWKPWWKKALKKWKGFTFPAFGLKGTRYWGTVWRDGWKRTTKAGRNCGKLTFHCWQLLFFCHSIIFLIKSNFTNAVKK